MRCLRVVWQQVGDVGKAAVGQRAVAAAHEQPAAVALLKGMFGNALVGQGIVKFAYIYVGNVHNRCQCLFALQSYDFMCE